MATRPWITSSKRRTASADFPIIAIATMTKGKLIVQDTVVSFTRVKGDDFISLTDIARVKNPDEPKDVVKNWLRTRATVEFPGLWEKINNPAFKWVEFDPFKAQAGSNSFAALRVNAYRPDSRRCLSSCACLSKLGTGGMAA